LGESAQFVLYERELRLERAAVKFASFILDFRVVSYYFVDRSVLAALRIHEITRNNTKTVVSWKLRNSVPEETVR